MILSGDTHPVGVRQTGGDEDGVVVVVQRVETHVPSDLYFLLDLHPEGGDVLNILVDLLVG